MGTNLTNRGEQEGALPETEAPSVWLRTRVSLLHRLRGEPAGDDWQDFYEMYWRPIYGYARRFGLPPDDADDLVQEVMVTLFRKLPEFPYDRSRGRFLGWVKTVTRHRVTDVYRRRAARMEGGLRVEPKPDGADPIEQLPAAPPDDPWEEEWRNGILDLALSRVRDQVEPSSFEAFQQYALKGRSPQEVAQDLGMDVSNVYVIKNRILRRLRDEVARIVEEV